MPKFLSLKLIIVLAIALSSVTASSAPPVDQWEYGTLRYVSESKSRDKASGPRVIWMDAKGVTKGDGWDGMAEKIAAAPLSEDVLKRATDWEGNLKAIRIFNALGAQGWEMAAYDREGFEWTFKRRLGK